jgi:hypothetical protein
MPDEGEIDLPLLQADRAADDLPVQRRAVPAMSGCNVPTLSPISSTKARSAAGKLR